MTELLTPSQVSREMQANAFELLTPRQTAKLLHVTYGTLAAWRCNRRYPLAYVRIGRKIYYRPQDIEAYIAASVLPGDRPRKKNEAMKTGRDSPRKLLSGIPEKASSLSEKNHE
jgi:hypothetical protein